MLESIVQKMTRLRLSTCGFTMWRNNVGSAWQGNAEVIAPSRILISNARRVAYGLTKGASDLIGFKPVVITQEMVGKTFPIFTVVETKRPGGRISAEQNIFLDCIRKAGGIAIVAKKPDDINEGLASWMKEI